MCQFLRVALYARLPDLPRSAAITAAVRRLHALLVSRRLVAADRFECAKKLLLSGLLTFVFQDEVAQAAFAMMVALVSVMMLHIYQPCVDAPERCAPSLRNPSDDARAGTPTGLTSASRLRPDGSLFS